MWVSPFWIITKHDLGPWCWCSPKDEPKFCVLTKNLVCHEMRLSCSPGTDHLLWPFHHILWVCYWQSWVKLDKEITRAHLTVHVHDDHCVGVVTDHKLLRVCWVRNHIVDRDFWVQRFKSVDAVTGLCIPNLKHTQRIKSLSIVSSQLSDITVTQAWMMSHNVFTVPSLCHQMMHSGYDIHLGWRLHHLQTMCDHLIPSLFCLTSVHGF